MKGSSVLCMKKINGLLPDLKESLTGMHFLSSGERTPENSPRVRRRDKQTAPAPSPIQKPLPPSPASQPGEGTPTPSPLETVTSPFKGAAESDVEAMSKKYHDLKHYYRKRINQQSISHPEESDLYIGTTARSNSTEGEGEGGYHSSSPSATELSQESQPSSLAKREDDDVTPQTGPSSTDYNQIEDSVFAASANVEFTAALSEGLGPKSSTAQPEEGVTPSKPEESGHLCHSTPKSPTTGEEEDKDSVVGRASFTSRKSLFDDSAPSLDVVDVCEEDRDPTNKPYLNGGCYSSQKGHDKSLSSLSFGNSLSSEDADGYMWVISDDNRSVVIHQQSFIVHVSIYVGMLAIDMLCFLLRIYFYLLSRSSHKPVGLAPLPTNAVASCLE